MAVSLLPLRNAQVGIESTKGTSVAATSKRIGRVAYTEEQQFYRSPHPQGVRANVGGAGVISRKGATWEYETELTAEEFLLTGLCGIYGGATAVGTTAKVWTFTPELTTSAPNLKTATWELVDTDGSTNHLIRENAYAMCSGFTIAAQAGGEMVSIRESWFGRARQTDTPTGSLSALTGREVLVPAMGLHYLDSSWAGLGGTQLTLVRSIEWGVQTGIAPDHTMAGRTDLDFYQHQVSGKLAATCTMVLELDATGAARVQDFRDNDIVFVRSRFQGSIIAASDRKYVQLDGAFRFVNYTIQEDGEVVLASLSLESVYDTTGTSTFVATVQNALATGAG